MNELGPGEARLRKVLAGRRQQTTYGAIIEGLLSIQSDVQALTGYALERLHAQVHTCFDNNEINDLALMLCIEPDDLAGDTRQERARSLVDICLADGRIDSLIVIVQKERPKSRM